MIVNLPVVLKGAFALVGVLIGYLFLSAKWPVSVAFLFAPELLIFLFVAHRILCTVFTEIIIDSERITCRQGILNKEVSSLELFRIQDVTSLHPWWQRFFDVGTIVVMSSDSHSPIWRLHGLVDAENLRNDLNRAAIALRDKKGIREVNMGRI